MDEFMEAAIAEARAGYAEGGIPIGSVIVVDGKIIGRGRNRRVQDGNPILHGEMSAFTDAGRQPHDVYERAVLYTTLTPCWMCAGTTLWAGIKHVVAGENITAPGAEDWLRSMGVEVAMLDNEECIDLMARFIAERPDVWAEDKMEPHD